jgi:hypothetical protein
MQNLDMKRIFFEYFAGLLLSVVGFFVFLGVYSLLALVKIYIGVGGDKAKIFFGLFLGLPLGSLLGMLLVDILVYKIGLNYFSLAIAATLSFLGVYCGVIMLDKVGGLSALFIPVIVTGLCLLGLNKFFF